LVPIEFVGPRAEPPFAAGADRFPPALSARHAGGASAPLWQSELSLCRRGTARLAVLGAEPGWQARQVFVPKEGEERIRQNVQGYQEIQQLLEELSEVEWQRLLDRRESPRSPTSD
jgi:hypothetical protein